MNWNHRATPVRMLHEMVASFRPKDSKACAPYATRFGYLSANFAIEPLTAEFVEALNYAQRVYVLVLMPSPGWRSG